AARPTHARPQPPQHGSPPPCRRVLAARHGRAHCGARRARAVIPRSSRPMSGDQGHTLDIDSVTHRYGPVTAVADVSLAVRAGEIVALLGPSGCGKTTLLRVVAGFVRQSAGSVRIDGKAIDHLPANLRNVGI